MILPNREASRPGFRSGYRAPTMIESHLAPDSLAAARARIDERVGQQAARGLEVVELGPDAPAAELARIPSGPACVVSELRLWAWSETDRRALADALGPHGMLLFLEPTADLGWRRAVHRLFRRPIRSRLGHHFEADVPAGLRAVGLLVGTADRFPLGRLGLGSYVWGRAERIGPDPAADDVAKEHT